MRRGAWSRLAGTLLVVPLALAVGCRGTSRPGRVIVLGLDGLDPRAVDLLMSEGKLPHFAKLRQEGAYGRLQSSKPLLSPVVWTTIATGKTPDQHGIGHFVAIDEKTGEALPVTSEMRRVKAVWEILSDSKKKVGVVGWWTTWPADTVNGAIVSDHTCYHFLFPQGAGDQGAEGKETSRLTYPPELFARVAPLVRRPTDVTLEEAAPFIQVTPEEFARPFDFQDDLSHFKWLLATAESYRRIGLQLWQERPDLLMVYIEGTDSVAHLFGHLFRAGPLSGELAVQQKRFGAAVEQMYLYADRLVGEYMNVMDRDTTLVVASDHGFELGAAQDDPSKTRDMRRVSEQFHRVEGVVYLFGNQVKRARLEEPKILDIAPTLLALSGLAPARDMPGRVLTEGLDLEIPGPAVATYELGDSVTAKAATDTKANAEILERLKSLGYLGGGSSSPTSSPTGTARRSPQGERNLAAMRFEAGRYREAAEVYARLLQDDPNEASLHTSLAGALGALGRYEEAAKHLDIAIKLEPLNVEAYHNRAVILERQGKVDAAVEQYRTAVRYDSRYEPARRALVRLTGSGDVGGPRTEAEKRAFTLAEAASQAARRGDYTAAMKQLSEAEQLAPRYALVYQYQSNVAYLMGDTPTAIKALEKAIALEPKNALFQTNLKRLKQKTEQERPRP